MKLISKLCKNVSNIFTVTFDTPWLIYLFGSYDNWQKKYILSSKKKIDFSDFLLIIPISNFCKVYVNNPQFKLHHPIKKLNDINRHLYISDDKKFETAVDSEDTSNQYKLLTTEFSVSSKSAVSTEGYVLKHVCL